MIDRLMNYLYKNGEFDTDTVDTVASWVGGSPVGIRDNGSGQPLITANFDVTGHMGYIGIAAHSQARDLAMTGKSTYYKGPAIFTLIASDDEEVTPWKTGLTWAVRDLVRPIAVTDGVINWSQWTNEALTDLGAFYGQVVEVVGSPTSPTSITIEFYAAPVVI